MVDRSPYRSSITSSKSLLSWLLIVATAKPSRTRTSTRASRAALIEGERAKVGGFLLLCPRGQQAVQAKRFEFLERRFIQHVGLPSMVVTAASDVLVRGTWSPGDVGRREPIEPMLQDGFDVAIR